MNSTSVIHLKTIYTILIRIDFPVLKINILKPPVKVVLTGGYFISEILYNEMSSYPLLIFQKQ